MNKVLWCDRGWMPYCYGFCPNEKAWRREMKLFGDTEPYPTADAHCAHFVRSKDRNACTIVTVGHDKVSSLTVAVLIVHEAMHIWREMRDHIGEKEPSHEFEAYQIQSITANLLKAYEKTRGRLFLAR